MKNRLLKFFLDLGVLLGTGFFVFGLYCIWHPLAPLVGGLLLAAFCFFTGYGFDRRETRS